MKQFKLYLITLMLVITSVSLIKIDIPIEKMPSLTQNNNINNIKEEYKDIESLNKNIAYGHFLYYLAEEMIKCIDDNNIIEKVKELNANPVETGKGYLDEHIIFQRKLTTHNNLLAVYNTLVCIYFSDLGNSNNSKDTPSVSTTETFSTALDKWHPKLKIDENYSFIRQIAALYIQKNIQKWVNSLNYLDIAIYIIQQYGKHALLCTYSHLTERDFNFLFSTKLGLIINYCNSEEKQDCIANVLKNSVQTIYMYILFKDEPRFEYDIMTNILTINGPIQLINTLFEQLTLKICLKLNVLKINLQPNLPPKHGIKGLLESNTYDDPDLTPQQSTLNINTEEHIEEPVLKLPIFIKPSSIQISNIDITSPSTCNYSSSSTLNVIVDTDGSIIILNNFTDSAAMQLKQFALFSRVKAIMIDNGGNLSNMNLLQTIIDNNSLPSVELKIIGSLPASLNLAQLNFPSQQCKENYFTIVELETIMDDPKDLELLSQLYHENMVKRIIIENFRLSIDKLLKVDYSHMPLSRVSSFSSSSDSSNYMPNTDRIESIPKNTISLNITLQLDGSIDDIILKKIILYICNIVKNTSTSGRLTNLTCHLHKKTPSVPMLNVISNQNNICIPSTVYKPLCIDVSEKYLPNLDKYNISKFILYCS
ncbi:hypothetical protein NEOKW01_1898 [Nematocida sp. AWRm80]|nr:hypothetical protein NEOKW01_1898 [Nematocida sp. AWRm80]